MLEARHRAPSEQDDQGKRRFRKPHDAGYAGRFDRATARSPDCTPWSERSKENLLRRLAVAAFAAVFAFLPACRAQRRAAPAPPALSAAAPVESDDGVRPAPAPTAAARDGRRVLWIGLDGADWDYLGALAARGLLPNWDRLAKEGFGAKLTAFEPMLSPLLWTTQATGVGPDVHRVLDFQEVDPSTGRLVPVSQASRKAPAVWSLASHLSRRVGVVGFWASHPAEIVNGFFLSDRIAALGGPLAPGAAYPERLVETVARVRQRDGRPSPADIAAYVAASEPEIAAAIGADASRDPIAALSEFVGATRVTQRLARELYDRERPDFLAVYFEGTDEIGHVFAPFAPPKLDCADEAAYARFHRAPETYFRTIDALLGQWMRRAREDGAVLVITSDHGFQWGAGRACGPAAVRGATAALAHRREGVFLAWGAGVGVSRDARAVSSFDVAPTLLALLGLPVDRSMRGAVVPVLPGLARGARADIASTVAVRTMAAAPIDAGQAAEYAKKLAALGYISAKDAAPAGAPPVSAGLTKGAWNNLGVYRRFTANDSAGARKAFGEALALDPGYPSPMLNLARLEKDAGRLEEASQWLVRAAGAGLPDAESTVERWAADFERRRPAAALALLARARAAIPGNEAYARLQADALARRGRCGEAAAALAALENSREPATLNMAAALQGCLNRPDRAAALLRRSLELDPNQPRIRELLASLPF